jgi:hypothetical protein
MKKQLLSLAVLISGFAAAQTWTQNFNSVTTPGLPAGWMQNNVDGLTPNSSIVSYSFASCGTGTNGCAGVTRDITAAYGFPAAYTKALITTARYNPAGTSDDWVICPQFTVPPNGVFNWEACSFDPTVPNAYEIRISTTGTTVANFNANPILFSTSAETAIVNVTDPWQQRGVSLNTYSNQAVYIAVHEKSVAKWQCAYDNFSVTVPTNAVDGQVLNFNGVARYMLAGNTAISGTFKQVGYGTATTAVMNYKVDANAPVTETITLSPSVPYFGTQNFAMTTQANITVGAHTITLWVSAVNGVSEVSAATNTVSMVVYAASTTKTRNSLIEEFSSSTCVPCAGLNATFDPFINGSYSPNTGGTLNIIKNQVNWPSPSNDPSYNPSSAARVTYYGINAAPTALIDGTTDMVNHSAAEISAAQAVPAYAQIMCALTVTNNQVSASSTVTPYLTIPTSSPLKVHQALLQKNYTFSNPSTTQQSFWHVMRMMQPSSSGTAFTPADGIAQTFTFNATTTSASIYPPLAAQNSSNFWSNGTIEYELVTWLQDATTGDILQSGSAQGAVSTVGLVELKNDSKIGVHPNPAQNNAVVAIKLTNSSSVDITIYDVAGKVVFTNKGAQINPGQNEISINTSEFANGAYSIVVNTNEGVLTEKLIINK